MSAEAGVAEPVTHQAHPQVRDGGLEDARGGRPVGEAEPGHRGDHDIEGVLGPATVRSWVRQQRQQVEVLGEGARPPVREHDRQRIGTSAALVHEVHPQAVNLRPVVRKAVEPALVRAPVEVLGPSGHQLSQVGPIGAVRPPRPLDLVRPPGASQPLPQVHQHRLVQGDGVRLDANDPHPRHRREVPPRSAHRSSCETWRHAPWQVAGGRSSLRSRRAARQASRGRARSPTRMA